ncbi:MAG: hypothetical protein H7837_03570 [Magnetococcus sp. MYC-9]
MEESDKDAVQEGVGAGSGAGVLELALMFDLTGEEIEKIEDAGELRPALEERADPDRMALSARDAGRYGEGPSPEDWANRHKDRQADFKKLVTFAQTQTSVDENAGELEAWDGRSVAAAAVGAGSGEVEPLLQRVDLPPRRATGGRLATEFLGPPPDRPLPETPVMEAVEDLFAGLERHPEPAPEEGPAELEAVPEAELSFPSWADSLPSRKGSVARRVMPWLPSTDEESPGERLQESDAPYRERFVAGRSGVIQAKKGSGAYDLEDTEPFDLQHVALITEGTSRRDVFKRTNNLGEEIIVRLTFPAKPAAAAAEPAPEIERSPSPADGPAPGAFSAEALVSLFSHSAATDGDLLEAVPTQEPTPPVVESVAIMACVPELEPVATIPVWQSGESGRGEEPAVAPVELQPSWEGVEPFDVDSLVRVVRERDTTTPETVGDAGSPERSPAGWPRNPWDAEGLPEVAGGAGPGRLPSGGWRSEAAVERERMQSLATWAAQVAARERGATVAPSSREMAAELTRPLMADFPGAEPLTLFQGERVEPFDVEQVVHVARQQSAQAAVHPSIVEWRFNPWDLDQLPAGVTDRPSAPPARPAEAPGLKVEIKTGRVGGQGWGAQPVAAPRPTVVAPATLRLDVGGKRVVPPPVRVAAAEAAAAVPPQAQGAVTALEMELLTAIRESARVARESANVVRESAVLAAESAHAIRRAAHASGGALPVVRPPAEIKQAPPPQTARAEGRVVVPVEKMFSGISNALGDAVGVVVGRRPAKKG